MLDIRESLDLMRSFKRMCRSPINKETLVDKSRSPTNKDTLVDKCRSSVNKETLVHSKLSVKINQHQECTITSLISFVCK